MEKQEQPVVDTAKAEKLLADLRETSTQLAVLVAKAEELKVRDALGGQTEAGQVPPTIDPEEVQKKRINKFLENTGRQI